MTERHPGSRLVQQAVIDGLLRRAAAQCGPVRQALLQRAQQWQGVLDTTVAAAAGGGVPQPPSQPLQPSQPSQSLQALATLVASLGRGAARPAAMAAFHGTWSRLRTQQRLRQALDVVPQQAGPLHSAQLVHRALQALHGLSPAYLEATLSHLDTLLWLDAASGAGLPARPAVAGVQAATSATVKKKRPGQGRGAK